jgi:multidrug resistance efflux pump
MEETRIRIDTPRKTRALIVDEKPPRPSAIVTVSSPAVVAEKRGRPWSRLVRWIVGGAMLAEAAWLLAPTVLYRTSVRATITAPLVAVRVHQEGVVVGTPPVVGTPVTAGQTLFEIQTAGTDRRPSERIRAEIDSIRRTADALKTQIAEMDELKAALGRHFDAYRDARIAQDEKQLAEQQARVDVADARHRSAEFELGVQTRLGNRGASSGIELSRAENTLVETRHELEQARHAELRQRLQLEAARKGIFVGEADGGQDRVASRQRCDEIVLQQAGLRARLGELDGRLRELHARLDSEERYLAGTRRPIVAPIGGVVWSSSLTPGAEVSAGSTAMEIVDPGRSHIEAFFKEADAERIRPGVPVLARLLGSTRILRGRVARVADPGAVDQGTVAGAVRDAAPPRTFRVIVELDEPPAGGGKEGTASVGRAVVVWTPR